MINIRNCGINFHLLTLKALCATMLVIPTASMAIPLLKYQLDPGATIVTFRDAIDWNIDKEESITGYFTLEEVSPEAPLTEAEKETFGGAQIFKIVDLFFESDSYQLTKMAPESDTTYNILALDTCSTPAPPVCANLLTDLLVGTGFDREPGDAITLDAHSTYTGDKKKPEKISAFSEADLLTYTPNIRHIGIIRNFSATRVDPPIQATPIPEISSNGTALGMSLLIGLLALMREKYRRETRRD